MRMILSSIIQYLRGFIDHNETSKTAAPLAKVKSIRDPIIVVRHRNGS